MRPHHIDHILITDKEIRERIDGLVNEMADTCQSEQLILVGVLRGSFMFLADLVRKLYEHKVHPRIDFMTLSSRGSGIDSTGSVVIRKDVTVEVTGAEILLVDDILDTGRTLDFGRRHLLEKGAARVRSCMLLDKPSRREIPVTSEYTGFTVEDVFVVGYGLDYDSHYRELPYIAEVTFTDE
jgi:hypoxanthine phosphoribosyltransferase